MIKAYYRSLKTRLFYSTRNLKRKSNEELLALLRHDCHRIEKAVYNDNLDPKKSYYDAKHSLCLQIMSILASREAYPENHPVLVWAREISGAYPAIATDFIHTHSQPDVKAVLPDEGKHFLEIISRRRSCRAWAKEQPDEETLISLAREMILAGTEAPNSGNRQPWKFVIITSEKLKGIVSGMKEAHCYTAPLLVFVGLDKRFYKPALHLESSQLLDAGAAIMQMVNHAHFSGYGVSWNYLGFDFIQSRKQNAKAYHDFCKATGTEDYILPVSILSVGIPAYIPPKPARLPVDEMLLSINGKN